MENYTRHFTKTCAWLVADYRDRAQDCPQTAVPGSEYCVEHKVAFQYLAADARNRVAPRSGEFSKLARKSAPRSKV